MDYQNSQVAEIYDAANPLGEDGHFYLALAGRPPRSVLDLGCGTGALCCALAERGHAVTGVDPAGAMLDVARRKLYAEQVEWVESTAQSYRSHRRFDLIVMTGHAFQALLTDRDILAVLKAMRIHLNEGARAAFETRNPQIDWAADWAGRRRELSMPSGEAVVETLEVTGSDGEFISFRTSYRFPQRTLVTNSMLRFARREHIEALIDRAGLAVEQVCGDWNSNPFDAERSREIVFLAESAG
jgi:ubiquinone/menaquinone biosynthesis C-methylase UbiE